MSYKTIFLLVTLTLLVCVKSESVSVVTKKGTIIGQKSKGYDTYFGVPYAKVDEANPFGKSIEYPNFGTPFIANDSNVMCPQVISTVGGILDCLRLNIYVPHRANTSTKLPILVWIYGGGFVMGYAGQYGAQYLVKHDIIVITVNYRLGPYGFLCLDETSVPGNQGLKDQIAALRWIKANIDAFGGDNTKVTIAGESYGGGSVDLHLYSLFETLFDKAIVQSGSKYSEGLFVKPDYKAAVKIAKYLGHNVTKTKEALKFLSKKDPIDVMTAAKNLSLRLTVCKEKRFSVQNFVNRDPFHLNNRLRIKNTAIMIGYNSKEGFDSYVNKSKEFFDHLGDIFYNALKNNFVFKEYELKTLSDLVRRFYLGNKGIAPESILELSDFMSDFMLNNAAERSVNDYIQQGGTVYKYLFSYVGGSQYQNITGVGAIHTEELKYLFESEQLVTDEQRTMRDRVTLMWAQFVKFGNPTPVKSDLLPVTWEPVKGKSKAYMNIDVNMTMEDYVYKERMAFWELFWFNYDKRSVVFDRK